MTDDEKLEKAFNHIRYDQRKKAALLDAAENEEWELAASIVEGVLAVLGLVVSAVVSVVSTVAEWISDLF